MYDYDAEYRRLKITGHRGWSGSSQERNLARMTDTLDRLEREFLPSPPARILELGCGVFVVSSMFGLPKSDQAKARFDPINEQLLRNGHPYRTLKPLTDIVRELMDAGFEVRDSAVSINSWWDHATIVCRIAETKRARL